MVLIAWSILGAALGPLVLLRMHDLVPKPPVAISMMLVGTAVAFFWKARGWSASLYEIVPGMCAALLVLVATRFVLSPEATWVVQSAKGTQR
jgi:hypothetical protein